MTTGPSDPDGVQQAIDFLSAIERRHAGQGSPRECECEDILLSARRSGFDFDEPSLQQAFALIMRARIVSSRHRRQT